MIHVYTKPGSSARQVLQDTIPQPRHGEVEWHEPTKKTLIPKRADLVVHCGKGAPSNKSEWFAAQKGCVLSCLPEATGWVQDKLNALAHVAQDTVIVDAALVKVQAIV